MLDRIVDWIFNIVDPFGRRSRFLKYDNKRRLDNLSRMYCDEASRWAGRRVTEEELIQIGRAMKNQKKRRR